MTNSLWLLEHKKDIFSQSGEDGIIEAAIARLPDNNKWCVEFGALDGVYLSNTRNLILNADYSAVLIEASRKYYKKLESSYADNSKVTPLNRFVGFSDNDNLDSILEKTDIPVDFDFLSIDIDGNDYHTWDAISTYIPRLICIEYNPSIPNQVSYIQKADPSVCQGSSLRSLIELGKRKGYELIAVNGVNAFFVLKQYFHLFDIQDNQIDTMHADQSSVTYLFTGYDGRIMISGAQKLPWHGIAIKERKLQHLPFFLRNYPGNYNKLQIFLFGIFLLFKNPKLFFRRVNSYLFKRNKT